MFQLYTWRADSDLVGQTLTVHMMMVLTPDLPLKLMADKLMKT
jgi:hypothetical protein